MPVEGLRIRRAEPDDYSAVYEMFATPGVFSGTLQLPYLHVNSGDSVSQKRATAITTSSR